VTYPSIPYIFITFCLLSKWEDHVDNAIFQMNVRGLVPSVFLAIYWLFIIEGYAELASIYIAYEIGDVSEFNLASSIAD